LRVPYEDYKSPKTNTICDEECRDEGMLVGLKEYIAKQKSGDIFIVLHQMGNHGPAYFKRYPEKFEVFKPACKNYDLGSCTQEEINNAYDNAILYTDYFLSKVIQFLKGYSKPFETMMFYVSDHGESLGENGIYLHGLPYLIAPVEQKKVPMVVWFGDYMSRDVNIPALEAKLDKPQTHDNVLPTLLKLMEVDTKVYDSSKNLIDKMD
jgi:lipid A ethanolaminephosphotransferase